MCVESDRASRQDGWRIMDTRKCDGGEEEEVRGGKGEGRGGVCVGVRLREREGRERGVNEVRRRKVEEVRRDCVCV